MALTLNFKPDGDLSTIQPEEGAPAPDRLMAGDPKFTSWNLEEAEGGLYAGIWQATPGKWRVEYDEWEYFNILEGHSILTVDGGEPIHLKAGDRQIIRPGFKGTWEVVETTRKDYVVRL
ncbi:cupin domain-containing protein [Agrobacterium cavarae]|uniref:cupin domain-containing protein n=1 Tax=Agrobacterium cavarae TaxID=2528239 RepID=UPI003FD4C9DB